MAVVVGNNLSNNVFGTNANDELYGLGGNDVLEGFAGNDFMDGGSGFDTANYSRIGRAITLLRGGFVSKGGLGVDRFLNVEQIIAPAGFANTIDGSAGGNTFFNINLGANSLVVNNVPGLGTLSFTVRNFVNARGTQNGDEIIGSNQANFIDGQGGNDLLIGSGGNDRVVGNSGVDIINGTSSTARGFREFDVLTGGTGNDGYILGDRAGSYYRAGGFSDFARITDFTVGDLIQLGAGETYQAIRDSFGFDVYVLRDGGADLIADVRTTSLIGIPSGAFSLGSNQEFGPFFGA